MPKVFVTDAQQHKSLPIIRTLGRKGISVTAGDDNRFSFSFFSKYCAKSIVYPSPIRLPELFIEWLINHIRRNAYDVIFPIDEHTLVPVTLHLDEISKYAIVPVVDHSTYMKARNKSETIKIALECDVPCPKTYFITDLRQVKELAKMIDFPAVIKPRESSGSRGIAYVKSKEQLYPEYCRIHSQYEYPLIQEFIPPGGDTFGVEALFNRKSELRAIFAHKRLREYPVSGGPSTLRESIYDPQLIELGIRLLKALNWYGVAQVEFKVDPRDGKPKLMEVNPKFWGSIELSIVSGVDFPYLLYKMAIDGDVEPVFDYKVGMRCRWLLPGDILNFITNPNRFKSNNSFFHFFDENLKYDIISKDDPLPILGIFVTFVSKLFDRSFWRKHILR